MNQYQSNVDNAGVSPLQAIFEAQSDQPRPDSSKSTGPKSLSEIYQDSSTNRRAYSEPADHLLPCLHFVLSDGSIVSFQYYHLESPGKILILPQGSGHRIELTFRGTDEFKISIEGHDLLNLYDHLNHHRIAWVREFAEDLNFDSEPRLKITIES